MSENNGSAPAGNPAPGAGGGGAGDWIAGIPDEGLRGYVQTKGFKDPVAVVSAYQNLEKLVGVPQDRLLKLPEKPDAPEWDGVYARLGRPEKPDGYELKFEGDDAFAKAAAAAMHKAGLNKGQAGVLNEFWNGHIEAMIKADQEARAQQDAADMAGLRQKWGGEFDKNSELGRRAGREFGLSEEQFKSISGALGSAATLELFAKIGSKLGEAAPFDAGGGQGGGGFGMTPEAAKARIDALKGDSEWVSRYLNGGAAEKAEMERLQRIMAGSQ